MPYHQRHKRQNINKTMKLQTYLLSLLLLPLVTSVSARVRYCSPTGNDPEGLSADTPGALRAMVEGLEPGDTLLLLDGQYNEVNTLVVYKNATIENWITICAAPGAKPVLDFRQQPNGTNGVKITGRYIRVKDLTIRYAGKKGIWLENASYCLIENLDVYGCCDSGIQLRKGGYNTVVNCDSHDNFDYQDNGGNADGFADKQGGAAFPGNTYIGCRAWHNSDDGWDSFQRETKDTPTVYLYCVTYNNGPAEFDLSQHPRATGVDRDLPCMAGKDLSHFPNGGNPNGFKMGGQGKDNKASGNYTRHNTQLSNCIAVGHRMKGFDQNNNAGEMNISHCLAVDNVINYGFGNPYPGTLNISSCISITPVTDHLLTTPEVTVNQENNSWNEGHQLDTKVIDGIDIVKVIMEQRQPDGSLPLTLLRIMNRL